MEEITPVREEEEREEDTPSEQPATSSTADKDTPEARKDAAGAENENDAQAENELVFSIAKTKARSWTSLFYGTEAEAKVLRGRSENSAAAEAIREREEEGLFVPSVPAGSSRRVRDEILASGGKTSEISWSHTTAPVALQRFGPSEDPDSVSRPIRKFVPNTPHLKVYHASPHKVVDSSVDDQSFQLDVHVGTVEFTCHPLMTREVHLTAQLKRCYRDYKRRERANMKDFYERKIETLEESILGARDAAFGGFGDRLPRESSGSLTNLKQLELGLIDARQKLAREEEEEERVTRELLSTYEALCSVRRDQGSANTDLELRVVEEPADLKRAEARFKLDCRLLAAEREDVEGLDEYSQLSGVSFQPRRVDCTALSYLSLKKHRALQLEELRAALAEGVQPPLPRSERNDAERRVIQLEQKLVELGEFPTRVAVSDAVFAERARAAEAEARAAYEAVHAVPRQKIVLFVSTPQGGAAAGPPERKLTSDPRGMQKLRLSAKLLINDKEVGQTEEFAINPNFTVDFNWSFSVQVYRWPEKARLQLYERNSILQSKHLISETKLGIPMGEGDFEDLHPLSYEFSATVPFSPSWSATPQTLYMGGDAFVHCRWANKMDLLLGGRDGDDLEAGSAYEASVNPLAQRVAPKPPQYVTETMSRSLEFRQSIRNNKARLREWLKTNKIDPNDPKNFDFIYLIDADVDRLDIREGGGVYSVALPDDVKLEQDPLVGRKRQVLLRSRWDKKLPSLNETTSQSAPIPLNDRAIAMPATMVNQDLASRDQAMSQRRFQASKIASSKEALEIIERRNNKIHKFLVRTKKKIKMARLATQKMKEIRLEDTVKEVILPEIKLDLRFLKKLFAQNRKLRPKRRALKNIAIAPDAVEIVVGIEKGMHLPVRTQEGAGDEAEGATPTKVPKPKVTKKAAADHKLLRPYIEVIFQGKRSYSHISEGRSPIWNHEVRFPFSSVSGKITPSSLLSCKDRVTLNIFDLGDEELEDEPEGNVSEAGAKARKAPGVFLGTTSVPVSSIYRGRICQGNFPLQVPTVLLGYNRSKRDCSLSLYCTLQPSVSPPEPPKTSLLSRESDEVMAQSEVWVSHLRSLRQCKHREFKPLVPNSENVLNLITRFISPLPLPPGYSAATTPEMLRVAKLVSLIPHVDSQEEFEDISEIWLGCDDFLTMCAGDSKVHAITLCNFFLRFGHDAYVVAGRSHAQAEAYFVLTTNTPEGEEESASKRVKVWSPYTGRFYAAEDSGNELVSVSMIFNSKNVWANVQAHNEPWYMEWGERDNASEWLPFFGAALPAQELATNQKVPRYFKFKSIFFIELEASIEREVMNAITSARTYEYTHFNRRCSRMMKSLLQDLSKADQRGSISNEDLDSIKRRHDEELSSISRMYRIQGQPLCFPLTYMSEIQHAVLNTGIHKDYRNDVEMAVGVHVQYTDVNYICAIWVYVARLKKLWK